MSLQNLKEILNNRRKELFRISLNQWKRENEYADPGESYSHTSVSVHRQLKRLTEQSLILKFDFERTLCLHK